MSDFKVGDKVVVINTDHDEERFLHMIGVICDIKKNITIGVDFKRNIDGHDCFGHCKSDQGWYFIEDQLIRLDSDKIVSLHKTKWVELCMRLSEENGSYIFIREPWLIDEKAVSVLPYRITDDGHIELLLRVEQADVEVVGTIKGGCDKAGESTIQTAVRELNEEGGYSVSEEDMIPLGTVRPTKLNTTTLDLFAVDVTHLEQHEAIGDGTANEANAYCKWVSYDDAIFVQDPLVQSTAVRLVHYLLKESIA